MVFQKGALMSRYNDPSHLPKSFRGPTWEDMDRHTDEAYDRHVQEQIDAEAERIAKHAEKRAIIKPEEK